MGRRSRARERAAAAAPGSGPATPAKAGRRQPQPGPGSPGRPGSGNGGRRRIAGALNPFSFRPPSRNRVRYGAAGFGLSAAVFAVVGWLTGNPSWFNSAVLLAILALAWGVRAAFMRENG